ncbi:MAG: arylsulfatase [Bacteroidales bacterium]|nr:arylsulfatase [Bacteroidales bacterium]
MKRIGRGAALAAMSPLVAACGAFTGSQAPRPNILVILADDMGYSDIGCYGGEVRTPNIDSLAVRGVKWAQFYNNARSCPSRAALMTGLYPHETGVGWMSVADLQYPQYQGFLNDECVTVADVLSSAGYETFLAGKWHLSSDRQNTGRISRNWPLHRGFNHFWGIANGFSDYYDVLLNDGDSTFRSDSPGFYLTDAIADHACSFIGEHDFRSGPMFMYLAFTAPHYPLQAPAEVYRKYEEVYSKGWDRIREERFERQKALGLFNQDTELSPRADGLPAWDDIPEVEKHDYAMRMAIYAAQIEIMDAGIGRVVDALRSSGQLENTVIFFMSDNGASAEIKSTGVSKLIDGGPDTFESYMPVWANASDTPFKMFKHYTYEGGICSPLIVSWPASIPPRDGYIRDWGHFVDIMPTCVELAGARYPAEHNGHKIKPMRGTSLVPWFREGGTSRRGMYFWEHEGNIAVRDGKWKLVNHMEMGNEFDPSALRLYNISDDPTEMHDLASRYPARVRRMWNAWKRWAADADVLPMVLTLHSDRKMMDSQRINGSFDDGLGYWVRSSSAPAEVEYGISEGWDGSAARVEVRSRGTGVDDAVLSWPFSVSSDVVVSTGFSYLTDKPNLLTVKIVDKKHPERSPLERIVQLSACRTPRTVLFEDIAIEGAGHPKNRKYSLDLCFGLSEPGTVLIDNVVLAGDFEDYSIVCNF